MKSPEHDAAFDYPREDEAKISRISLAVTAMFKNIFYVEPIAPASREYPAFRTAETVHDEERL